MNRPQNSLRRMNKSKKLKILVVDDEPDLLDFYENFLAKQGYEISTATNGLDALTMIKENDYAVMISNLRMPAIDGIKLLKRIKNLKKDLIKIIVTCSHSKKNFKEVIKYGCFAYIVKPVDLRYLEITIKTAVSIWETGEEQFK